MLPCYLSALFQPLLHLLRWYVNIDGEVRRQELTDANVSNLIIVLHTYNGTGNLLVVHKNKMQHDTYFCTGWGEKNDGILTLLSDVALLEHGLCEHNIAKRRSLQDDSLALNADNITMLYPFPAVLLNSIYNFH